MGRQASARRAASQRRTRVALVPKMRAVIALRAVHAKLRELDGVAGQPLHEARTLVGGRPLRPGGGRKRFGGGQLGKHQAQHGPPGPSKLAARGSLRAAQQPKLHSSNSNSSGWADQDVVAPLRPVPPGVLSAHVVQQLSKVHVGGLHVACPGAHSEGPNRAQATDACSRGAADEEARGRRHPLPALPTSRPPRAALRCAAHLRSYS